MSEVSEFCLEKVEDLHVSAIKYSLHSLHKSTCEIMLNLTKMHGIG